MFYEFDLTIPSNTLAASPAELECVMAPGTIKQVEVQLPRGLRSMIHTVAWIGLHQLWPSNPNGTIKGDKARIIWGEDFSIEQPPHMILIRGWSPDTFYPHVITWRFSVTPEPVKEPMPEKKKPGILSALMGKGAS